MFVGGYLFTLADDHLCLPQVLIDPWRGDDIIRRLHFEIYFFQCLTVSHLFMQSLDVPVCLL